jgi:CheY-like chemotaxis protein
MAGELILIVEDNEKNLKLVRDLLQVKGYRTLEAATAELGIELARGHTPQLILMDIQLPAWMAWRPSASSRPTPVQRRSRSLR